MRKIILFTIILHTSLFSNNLFDISRLNFEAIEFNTKAKMRIYNNGKTVFNLPIEIRSKAEAIQKTKTGYLRKTTLQILFTSIRSNKMTINTQTFTQFDKNRRLVKLTEIINRNGEKQTVVCTPLREGLIEENYNKEIGYKSEVFLLNCDNNSQKKMQTNLQKTKDKDIANLTIKKNFTMDYNNIRYVVEETTKTTIDKKGRIKAISSKIKAKELFSIKYRVKDIVQYP